jgi:predicted kinase
VKRLILLAGIPGSGKTTLAQSLIAKGYLSLCADQIRQELWGNEAEQKEPEKVFAIFFERLEQALQKNLDIVIDNTNINRRHREPILTRAKNAGYTDIEIWLLETPLELCLARNKNRTRMVPEDILRNMHKTINGPGKPGNDEAAISIIDYSASKD